MSGMFHKNPMFLQQNKKKMKPICLIKGHNQMKQVTKIFLDFFLPISSIIFNKYCNFHYQDITVSWSVGLIINW